MSILVGTDVGVSVQVQAWKIRKACKLSTDNAGVEKNERKGSLSYRTPYASKPRPFTEADLGGRGE